MKLYLGYTTLIHIVFWCTVDGSRSRSQCVCVYPNVHLYAHIVIKKYPSEIFHHH